MIDPHFCKALSQLYPVTGVIGEGSRIKPVIDDLAQEIFQELHGQAADWLKEQEVHQRETRFQCDCYESLHKGVVEKATDVSIEAPSGAETLLMVTKVMEYLETNSMPALLGQFSPDERYRFEGGISYPESSDLTGFLELASSIFCIPNLQVGSQIRDETQLIFRVKAIPKEKAT